jgi:hypothetical protein
LLTLGTMQLIARYKATQQALVAEREERAAEAAAAATRAAQLTAGRDARRDEASSLQGQLEQRTLEHARMVQSLRQALAGVRKHGSADELLQRALTETHEEANKLRERERGLQATARELQQALEEEQRRCLELQTALLTAQAQVRAVTAKLTEGEATHGTALAAMERAVAAVEARSKEAVRALAERLESTAQAMAALAHESDARCERAEAETAAAVAQVVALGRELRSTAKQLRAAAAAEAEALRAAERRRWDEVQGHLAKEVARADAAETRGREATEAARAAVAQASITSAAAAAREREALTAAAEEAGAEQRAAAAAAVEAAAARAKAAEEALAAAEAFVGDAEARMAQLEERHATELRSVRREFRAFRDEHDTLVSVLQTQLDATTEAKLRMCASSAVTLEQDHIDDGGALLPPKRTSALRLWKLTSAVTEDSKESNAATAAAATRTTDSTITCGVAEDDDGGAEHEEVEEECKDNAGAGAGGRSAIVRAVMAEMREVRAAASSDAVLRQLERERLAAAGAAARWKEAQRDAAVARRKARVLTQQVREAQDAGRAEVAKLRSEFQLVASGMYSKEAYRALERQLAKAQAEARRLARELRGDGGGGAACGEEGAALAQWRAQAEEATRRLEAADTKVQQLRSAVARKDALVAELRAKLEAAEAGKRAVVEAQGDSGTERQRAKSLQAAVTRKDALVTGLRQQLEEAAAAAAAAAAEREVAATCMRRLRSELRARDEALRSAVETAEAVRQDAAQATATAEAAMRSEQRAWETAGADATAMRDRASVLLSALHAAVARSLRTALSLQHVAGVAAAAAASSCSGGGLHSTTTTTTNRRARQRARQRAAAAASAAAHDPEAIAEMVELETEEVCDILAASFSEFSLAANGPALVQLGASLTAAFARAEEALFSCTHRTPRSAAHITPAADGLTALREALAEVRVSSPARGHSHHTRPRRKEDTLHRDACVSCV